MSEAGGILLRIFTGPHAGAEIELGYGSYLLGSDEACDIILHDSSMAPRHARLVVQPAPLRMGAAPDAPLSAPKVWLAALEGGVQICTPNAFGEEDQRAAFPAPSATTAAPDKEDDTDLDEAADVADFEDGTDEVEDDEEMGQPLLPGVPCYLGFTCIAWAVPDAAAQTWLQVMHALEPLLNPGSQQHSPPEQEEDTQEDPQQTDPGASDAAKPPPDKTAEANRAPTMATGLSALANIIGITFPPFDFILQTLLRRVPIFLAALLLAGLCVSEGQKLENAPPSLGELRAKLADAGFSALEVVRDANDIRVRGTLHSDAERGRLVRMVQGLHYPVRLDVHMEGDAADALTAAFNSRGLYPEVRNDEKDARVLHIRGYMKDSTVEDWALAGARSDLPALPKEEDALKRRILHAEAVDTVLRPALIRAGLDSMVARYLPGTVEISGKLDVARRSALEKALLEVRKELDIPLIVAVHEKAPDLHASPRVSGTPEAAPALAADGSPTPTPASGPTQRTSLSPAFSVTSVTMQPLRFITLANGDRVFEGGLLAGGYTLENITTRQLTLRRNGQPTIYPLRGSHDTK